MAKRLVLTPNCIWFYIIPSSCVDITHATILSQSEWAPVLYNFIQNCSSLVSVNHGPANYYELFEYSADSVVCLVHTWIASCFHTHMHPHTYIPSEVYRMLCHTWICDLLMWLDSKIEVLGFLHSEMHIVLFA